MFSGFDPARLFAGLVALYDASDISTLFQDGAGTTPVTAAGQSVGRQNDKSGNGYHATQANIGNMARYQIDGNGHPYLLFDGMDDFYATPTITWGSDKATIVAGVSKNSDATAGTIAEFGTNGIGNPGSWGIYGPDTAGLPNYLVGLNGSTTAFAQLTTYPAPHTAVISARLDISQPGYATEIRPQINGSVPTIVNTGAPAAGSGNFGAHVLYIGRRAGVSLPFNGRLYCLAMWNRILTAEELAQAEAWANARTGAY